MDWLEEAFKQQPQNDDDLGYFSEKPSTSEDCEMIEEASMSISPVDITKKEHKSTNPILELFYGQLKGIGSNGGQCMHY